MDTIELFVPPSEEYVYKLGAAILATIIAIVAIYLILKTESEAEKVIDEIKHHNHKKWGVYNGWYVMWNNKGKKMRERDKQGIINELEERFNAIEK